MAFADGNKEHGMDFTGKVVLITGAGNGIGRAAATAFAERGARIVAVDRDADAVATTANIVRQGGGEASDVVADVSRTEEVQGYVRHALDTYGRIDCFFNNAGIEGNIAPTAEYDEDTFDAVIAVNVKGVFLGLRHVLPVMIQQGAGAVVNTASIAGLLGSPGMPAYVASKHAVIGLTKCAAGEVGPHGVRVNAVCPGPIDTRMIKDLQLQMNPADPEAARASYEASLPVGRFGTAEEVANVVLFLCSDLATNVTGAQYTVDGGRSATPGAVTSHSGR
jgi:NAD(P)-dependent dehydrogenase (short-subunit alcohol dehydrogenase family)